MGLNRFDGRIPGLQWDQRFPTKLVLTEDVEVFGLHEPLKWSAGTQVVLTGSTGEVHSVRASDGRTVRLPARLLKRA